MKGSTAMTMNRRSLIKTASWTTPVVLMSTVAPALATSVEPELKGLMLISYERGLFGNTVTLTTDRNDLGLYWTGPTRPTRAVITVTLNMSTKSFKGVLNGWKISGTTLTYEGTNWTRRGDSWYAPVFTTEASAGYARYLEASVRREVTVDGITYSTDSATPSSRRRSAPASEQSDGDGDQPEEETFTATI